MTAPEFGMFPVGSMAPVAVNLPPASSALINEYFDRHDVHFHHSLVRRRLLQQDRLAVVVRPLPRVRPEHVIDPHD